MISWTTPAKEEVDSYLNHVRASVATSGADASEVVDDLKRHIEEEIHTAHLETVTRDDVRRIVHRIGMPEIGGGPVLTDPARPPKADARNGHHAPPQKLPSRPGGVVLAFGVILPLITLTIEFFTHFCASTFFDPIPSYLHVLAVLAVPVVNLVLWRRLRDGAASNWVLLASCNAIVAGVALFYTLRYMLLLAPAAIALIFFGMGLLPMTPLLSFIATLRLRSRLTEAYPQPGRKLALGMLTGLVLVVAMDTPVMITYAGMSMADSPSSQTRASGIRLLRMLGNEQAMLRACYGRGRGVEDFDAYSLFLPRRVTPEVAREVYYRVNGQAFNAVPPPAVLTTQGRWLEAEREFTWDNDQGGQKVAGRIKGLSLANSRMDGLIDAEGAVGYIEWTLELNNVSPLQREARAQIALPPGGVVSRLTLWVNGEEREAAFAGRGEVRQAYQNVVVQRRDPVLVTSAGPDRVLMQCFPVPPDGGNMKVRIGITAPMEILDDRNGLLAWPCFLERNFSIGEEFRHGVWLESKQALSAPGLVAGRSDEGAFTLRGEVSDVAFSALKVSRDTPWQTTVSSDPRRSGRFVRQTITESPSAAIEQAYLVIDTSVSMGAHLAPIADALRSAPQNVRVTMLLPKDEGVDVFVPKGVEDITRRLKRTSAAGGKDNLPALMQAWDMAGTNANSIIVWIHGAQPASSRSFEQLKQRMDWHAQSASIIDVPVEPTPNRLLEQLEGVPSVRTLVRTHSLSADLGRLFASWASGAKVFQVTRESANESGTATRSSSHVVRLWAFEQIQQLIRQRHTTGAVELAALYQLVTPVSGAVVLESMQQFRQAGLNPVDASTVPSVPEPGTWILLAVGLLGLGLYRKFFRRMPRVRN